MTIETQGRSVVSEPVSKNSGKSVLDDTSQLGKPVQSTNQSITKAPKIDCESKICPSKEPFSHIQRPLSGSTNQLDHMFYGAKQQLQKQQQEISIALDPPIIEKRSSARSSHLSPGQVCTDTDADTDNTEGESYVSSVLPVSNDDVIMAVRGEKPAQEGGSGVAKKIDGFTSWIISGFDSLANVGLKAPIGFLDWSGEESQIRMIRVASGGNISERPKHVQDKEGVVTCQKAATSTNNAPPLTIVRNPRRHEKKDSTSCLQMRSVAQPSSNKCDNENEENEPYTGNNNSGFVHHPDTPIEVRNQTVCKEYKEVKVGVAAVSQGNAEQVEQQSGKILERCSKKLVRDNVSISTIEIPTPYEVVQNEDAHSVSILGLERSKKEFDSTIETCVHPSNQVQAKPKLAKQPVKQQLAKRHGKKTQQQGHLQKGRQGKQRSQSPRQTKHSGVVVTKKKIVGKAGKAKAVASTFEAQQKKGPFSHFGRRN
jgi:hypothetical protein